MNLASIMINGRRQRVEPSVYVTMGYKLRIQNTAIVSILVVI